MEDTGLSEKMVIKDLVSHYGVIFKSSDNF